MARVLVDTSAVYALLDRGDSRHRDASETLQALRLARAEPLLTNFLVAECHALVLSRLGPEVARLWLLGNVWPVERVSPEDETRAAGIIAQYTDKTFSYTDATWFAVMERLPGPPRDARAEASRSPGSAGVVTSPAEVVRADAEPACT